MRRKLIRLFILVALVSFAFLGRASALSIDSRAVIIIIDRVTWAELAASQPSNLSQLAKEGAPGLLINRTAGPRTTSVRSYATISAGTRADADADAGRGLNPRRFKELVDLNKKTGYRAQVGLLSTALRKGGVDVAVIGNADYRDKDGRYILGREVELLGADKDGRLPPGRKSLIYKAPGNGSISTDYQQMKASFSRLSTPASLVIVETGDTRRADMASTKSGEKIAPKMEAIARADKFIGWVAKDLDFKRDMLVVLSPSMPRESDGLTPIIMAGPDLRPGLLTSPSTRRPGLLVSLDVAPTVANVFGVDLGSQNSGRLIKTVAGTKSFQYMAQQAHDYLLSEELSVPITIGYSVAEAFLLVAGFLGLIFIKEKLRSVYEWLRLIIIFVLALPLGVFITPLLPIAYANGATYISLVLLISAVIAFSAWRMSDKTRSPIIFLTGSTTLFILVNLLIGAPGDGKSAFGYTAINASRFYGMGNHYLSFLLPAVLVFALLWAERSERDFATLARPLAIILGAIVFVVGFGGLGANTGGIIMMAPAFTLVYFSLVTQVKPRHFGVAALTTLAAVLMLAAADAFSPSEPTHLGIVTRQAATGAIPAFIAVIKRKVMLNVGVFNYSYWSYLGLAAFTALVVWQFFGKRQGGDWVLKRHPGVAIALFAGTIAGLVGALANDSGIAIMAMLLGYLLTIVLYLEICDSFTRE